MTRSKRRKTQRSTGAQLARRTVRTAPIASAALLAAMSTAYGQQSTTPSGLEEIIVTAQKREESMQDVPLAIQAIGNQRLDELNVTKFDDFVRFLPNVTLQTSGPGFAQVYFRGVSGGDVINHSSSQPSVGVYLDEQPITTIQGPLDIHMYDIQRVEALAGPQGTLFGASSQSGTLRIITNKPDLSGFDAGYGLELNTFSEGDLGYLAEGFVNLPIGENMAVRLVGWGRHDGGYIDNVRSTRVFPTSGAEVDNSKFIEDDYNDVDTWGARAALRVELNDNWTITPTIMGQYQKSNGSFAYDRTQKELEIAHTRPEEADDRWMQAALTVEGKVANFDVVYAGAYMFRDNQTESDYSDYSFWYDYLSGYGEFWYDASGTPIDPTQYIQGQDSYTKQSHELRLMSAQDERFRYTVGAFWQRQYHSIEQRYMIDGLDPAITVTGWPDTIWLTQQNREDIDYALFGQAEFDIVDKLTATVGLRYFWTENSLKGFFGFGQGYSPTGTGEAKCTINEPNGAAGPNFEDAPCLNLDAKVEQDDHSLKLGLNYRLTDDKMIYAIYAEGFRPGGSNRRGSLPPYLADFLDSYEVGWKTSWADNRLRFNGAFFFQVWDDFQYSVLGANGLTDVTNAAEAEIKGLEADLTWIATDRLSVTAGVSFLDSELTKPYCGYVDPSNNRPVSVDPCPTFDEDTGEPDGGFQDPEAPKGQQLPITPEFKGNMTGRYEFPWGSFDSYVQGSVIYVGERESDLRTETRAILGKLPSYTTVDLSTGIRSGSWNLELYLLNAFDELGEVSRFAQCDENICGGQTYSVITPPRLIGLKFSQSF